MSSGGGRLRSAHSVSSSSSKQSGPNIGASRPSTSFKSGEKHSSTAPSRQSCFQAGGRTFFNDLLGGSSRMASSYDPTQLSQPSIKNTGSRMLFTGPDQTEKHRINTQDRGSYVGSVDLSRERTSDCGYLYRPSVVNQPRIKMRHERVGEIGWNTIHLKNVNPPR